MNPYQIHWGIVITDIPLPPKKTFTTTDNLRLTHWGANALLYVANCKERCAEMGLKTMSRYKLTGKLLMITDRQFSLATIVSKDLPEEKIKLCVNLHYTLTIYTETERVILPVTKKQIDETIVVTGRGGVIVNHGNSIFTSEKTKNI